jgi:hypothetical protein
MVFLRIFSCLISAIRALLTSPQWFAVKLVRRSFDRQSRRTGSIGVNIREAYPKLTGPRFLL